jgi:uncharacterized protein
MSKPARTPTPKAYLQYVVDHPVRVIALTLLVTLLLAWPLPGLRFQTSIYDLVIEDLPQTAQYERFKQEFGCEEIILVVARTQNVFEPRAFERISALSKTLSDIKGVKRVISLPGIKEAMDLSDRWSPEDFRRIVAPVSLFERNIVSADGKTTVISLMLEDLKEKAAVIHAVQELINKVGTSLPLYQIGMPVVSKALAEFTALDFLTLPPLTLIVIALILFFLFQNLHGVLIPLGTVLIALVWTFGFMAWSDTPLSMITMIVPVFLIAVGTAYCMYIYGEYLAAVPNAPNRKEASLECFLQLGLPTSLSVITTTIGLCSLLVNRISAIREFALFSCLGILSMLFLLFSFVPALMSVLPFPKKRQGRRTSLKSAFMDRLLARIVEINLHHRKATYTILGIAALIGVAGIFRIQVETNPVEFFKSHTEVSRQFHDVHRDMAGSFPLNVIVSSDRTDYFENPANLEQIERLQEFMESLEGVDKTISFLDYVKLVRYATNRYEPEYYALPREPWDLRMVLNNLKSMLGQELLLSFVNPDFSKINILLRTHISGSAHFLAAKAKIEQYMKESLSKNLDFHVTGFGIVISQSSHLLTEGQVKSLSVTLLLIFLVMLFLFMSFKVGFIAMVPNLFPIIVTFGFMGWMGIPLSVATSLVASLAIGLAVDDTIHYLVRYNREFKRDLDKTRALGDTLRKVGRPIVFTTLCVGLGFSVLMLSNFKPTAVFGMMMVITMFSALVGDLILLPSLITHVELVTLWDLLKLKLGREPEKGITLFEGLSKRHVHYILMAGALKRCNRGEIIFTKGEVSDSMYAVISGQLEVVDLAVGPSTNPGIRRLIRTLLPGDVVGEMGMIRACKRSATVIASSPTELLQINERMIRRLHWLYPPVAQKFFMNLMKIVCDRLDDLTERYLESEAAQRKKG